MRLVPHDRRDAPMDARSADERPTSTANDITTPPTGAPMPRPDEGSAHPIVASALAAVGHPSLRVALSSPAVLSIAPEKVFAVPPEIVDALDRGKRILVVSHVLPPDGDCVGSALGLTRALRALGKEADACVDDDIPRMLAKIVEGEDKKSEILRASELRGDYDLVVVVDVAQPERIGGAIDRLVGAKRVVVIDHHPGVTTHESLHVAPSTELSVFVHPPANAASLLIAGVVRTLFARHPERTIDLDARRRIFAALAAGTYTDTDGFERHGSNQDSLHAYKFIVNEELDGKQALVTALLDHQLPAPAMAILAEQNAVPRLNKPNARKVRRRLAELKAKDVHVTHEFARNGATALLAVPNAIAEVALAAAKLEDQDTNMNDLRGEVLHELDQLVREHHEPHAHRLAFRGIDRAPVYRSAVLLWEQDGRVHVSSRSMAEGPARELVKHLAQRFGGIGGGHLMMGGAQVVAPLDDVAGEVRAWFAAHKS
jgi:nanoRNase/pAp phosphatase (c-di-AMP/oligoRNAs hydrolase)